MSFYRNLLATIAFFAVSLTATVWLLNLKGDILGPKVAECPSALEGLLSLVGELEFQQDLDQRIWDCSIGVALYIALPGIGLGWLVAKRISD